MERGYLGDVPVVLFSAAYAANALISAALAISRCGYCGMPRARHYRGWRFALNIKSKRRVFLAIFCVKIPRRRKISLWPKFVSSGHNLPF